MKNDYFYRRCNMDNGTFGEGSVAVRLRNSNARTNRSAENLLLETVYFRLSIMRYSSFMREESVY
jgi:hypothetical protein